MSHNHGVTSTPPSRRSVVKGAAWAVPAVVVATAAPTVAASRGPIEFTGGACKLPGNSSPLYKGYVIEFTGYNAPGPGPTTGITVITSVTVGNGQPETTFAVKKTSGPDCDATCATTTCGGAPLNRTLCTPDGATQTFLIYTGSQANSQNTFVSVTYQRYECDGCTPIGGPTTISSTVSTPPDTPNGGSCQLVGVFPIPS